MADLGYLLVGIDWPVDNHVMGAVCGAVDENGELPPWSGEVFDDPANVEAIYGWALDVGSRTDFGGVAYVQLLLDGNIIADTNEGSFYWPDADWDYRYYGHERMDIHNLYVDVPQSKHSGFSFLVDVKNLILANGYSQGLHLFKVRAGDRENNVTDIASLPVIFDCNDDTDDPSWGDIWTPTHMELVAGMVEISGFAIDTRTINRVEIWIDGVYIGDADYGLPSTGISDLYPWLPPFFANNRAFRYDLDTVAANLADGEHSLVVWTNDNLNGRNIIGERRFVLDNQSP